MMAANLSLQNIYYTRVLPGDCQQLPMVWIPDLPELKWSPQLKSAAIGVTENGRLATVLPDTNDTYHMILMCDEPICSGIVDVTVEIGGRAAQASLGCCYSFGVVPGPNPPPNFEYAFGYGSTSNRVLGWGLHDNSGREDDGAGIFSRGNKVAPSTKAYRAGDRIRMRVNVDAGDLEYWVNGEACAEIRNVDDIKRNGVFLAATIFNRGVFFKILEISS